MPFFAADPLACVITFGLDASPAFLRTLHALAINDGGGQTRLVVAAVAALSIERMMHSIRRAVAAPQVQIIKNSAAWGKILGDRPPLASRAQNAHDPVHNLPNAYPAPVAAVLGRWNQRFDVSPFFIGQVTRISQFATVVSPAVFRRPHGRGPRITRKAAAPWTYRPRVRQRIECLASENRVQPVAVDPRGTSRTCPVCGKDDRRNRNGEVFRYIACGHKGDADFVGARNVLTKTLAALGRVLFPGQKNVRASTRWFRTDS
jgi:Putative transposase DNA-binding domain